MIMMVGLTILIMMIMMITMMIMQMQRAGEEEKRSKMEALTKGLEAKLQGYRWGILVRLVIHQI